MACFERSSCARRFAKSASVHGELPPALMSPTCTTKASGSPPMRSSIFTKCASSRSLYGVSPTTPNTNAPPEAGRAAHPASSAARKNGVRYRLNGVRYDFPGAMGNRGWRKCDDARFRFRLDGSMSSLEADPDLRALRRTGLAVVLTCFVFNIFSRGMGDAYPVMVIPLEREFGWSRGELTGIYSVSLLVSGLVGPAAGWLFDRFGPRTVYATGLGIAGAALVAASYLERLLGFYLVIGLAVGIGVGLLGMVPAAALLARWYKRRLSTMIGIVFSAAGVGALIIVPLAQYLVALHSWRGAYRVLGACVLVTAVVQLFAVPWKRFAVGDPRVEALHAADVGAIPWTVKRAMATPLFWGLVRIFFFTSMGMYVVLVQTVSYLIDLRIAPLISASA